METMTLKSKRFIKRAVFLLMLLAFGMDSYASEIVGTVTDGGAVYTLYKIDNSVFEPYYYAAVNDFSSGATSVYIRSTITYNYQTYTVERLNYNYFSGNVMSGISSTTVKTIRFEGSPTWRYRDNYPTLNCPNLTDIYCEGSSPSFPIGSTYSDLFKSPTAGNVTLHLSNKSLEEIYNLKKNKPYNGFKDVVSMNETPPIRHIYMTIKNARVKIGNTYYTEDQDLQVSQYTDFTFNVMNVAGDCEVSSVKMNGREILNEMTFTESSSNLNEYYSYTLAPVVNDTYIAIEGERAVYEVGVICNQGGTLDCPSLDVHPIYPNQYSVIQWFKNSSNPTLTITPNAGYTLDNVYCNSMIVTPGVTQKSDGTYTYPLTGDYFISVMFKSAVDNIQFADANVKDICVYNWDTNHDGELSKAEAAAVTTLKVDDTSVFYDLGSAITSFDELQYFTGLTTIEDFAFYNSSLTSVVLPNSITAIGNHSFDGTQLKTILFPEGVTDIGDYSFYNVTNLESVLLPENLTKIGNFAFTGTAIRHIFIPQNVSYIGDRTYNPFSKCTNLVSIEVDERNQTYDSRDHCNAILYTWSDGTTAYVVSGCQSTVLPQNAQTKLIHAGQSSFEGMGLKKMVLPENFGWIYQYAFANNTLDSLIIKKKEAFDYKPYNYARSSTSAPNMLNTVVVVPYGTKAAYVAKGWIGEGDEGTQVVKKVIEAAPQPSDILQAVIIPAEDRYIKIFIDDDNVLGFDNKTFIYEMQKGGTYKIGVSIKSGLAENHLYINGVEQTEYVDNGDGYLTYTVTNVAEDMVIEANYTDKEWFIPICTTPGGKTSVYYKNTNGEEQGASYDPAELSIFELYGVKAGEDIRFLIEPKEGYQLFMVYYVYERPIGAEAEVKPLEGGSYEFILPANQITTDKTTPIIIYKKIGEDVNYDLNGDGTVNVVDLTKLVDYILHK